MAARRSFYLLLAVFYAVLLVGFAEAVTRLVLLPHNPSWAAMQDFAAKAKTANMTLDAYAAKEDIDPQMGWGRHTAVTWGDGDRMLLLVGDSVTAGHAVSPTESYAALLPQMPGAPYDKVMNVAVNGYGVDQMTLKLEAVLADLKAKHALPAAVVLAYIPHNLIRPANRFLYSLTKPRWDGMDVTPTVSMPDFVREAQHTHLLSVWLAKRYVQDVAYYAPGFFKGFYAGLFDHVAARLKTLEAAYGVPVRVVRLTNYLPFRGQAQLEGQWQAALRKAGVPLTDLDACVLPVAKAAGMDGAEIRKVFEFHPPARGHALYAECLVKAGI